MIEEAGEVLPEAFPNSKPDDGAVAFLPWLPTAASEERELERRTLGEAAIAEVK